MSAPVFLRRLAALAAGLSLACAPLAQDSLLDVRFGDAGEQALRYVEPAIDQPDEGLTLLRDDQGRYLAFITRRDAVPLAASRPLDLMLFRFLPSGELDTSLPNQFGSLRGYLRLPFNWTEFRTVKRDSQGRLLVVGTIIDLVTLSSPVVGFALARRLPNGATDGSFHNSEGILSFGLGINPANRLVDVVELPGGDLVVAGNLAENSGDLLLRRVTPNTGVGVESWGIGSGFVLVDLQPGAMARDEVAGLAALADGRVVVLGQSCTQAQGCLPAAARLTQNGALDASFCASQACIGSSEVAARQGRRVVHRAAFNAASVSDITVRRALRDPQGRLLFLATAAAASAGMPDVILLLRLLPDGDIDTQFGSPGTPGLRRLSLADADLQARSLALDESARLVIGGVALRSGLRRPFLARLGANGEDDPSFSASPVAEYFAQAEDRELAAVLAHADHVVAIGDRNGPLNRDGFVFRSGEQRRVFGDGFETLSGR